MKEFKKFVKITINKKKKKLINLKTFKRNSTFIGNFHK